MLWYSQWYQKCVNVKTFYVGNEWIKYWRHSRALEDRGNFLHETIGSPSLRQRDNEDLAFGSSDDNPYPHIEVAKRVHPTPNLETYKLRNTGLRAPIISFPVQCAPYVETIVSTSNTGGPWNTTSPNLVGVHRRGISYGKIANQISGHSKLRLPRTGFRLEVELWFERRHINWQASGPVFHYRQREGRVRICYRGKYVDWLMDGVLLPWMDLGVCSQLVQLQRAQGMSWRMVTRGSSYRCLKLLRHWHQKVLHGDRAHRVDTGESQGLVMNSQFLSNSLMQLNW